MASDTAILRSRRALLAAGVAAGAATVVDAIARPGPARADNGDSILLGTSPTNFNGHGPNEATGTTRIYTTTGSGFIVQTTDGAAVYGIWAQSSSSSGVGIVGLASASSGVTFGVRGQSDSMVGVGVQGYASAALGTTVGVRGEVASPEGTGVVGSSGQPGALTAPSPGTGVHGYAAEDGASVGVKGQTTVGTGVAAVATTGTALKVSGKAQFSRSGRASVAKRKTYVDITVAGGLAANSVVHATLQAYRAGVSIAAVRTNYPSAGKARIYLTKVASTTAGTPVGWFVAEY